MVVGGPMVLPMAARCAPTLRMPSACMQARDEHARDAEDDEQHPVVGLQCAQLVERTEHGEVQREHHGRGAHADGGETRAAELVRVAFADQEVDSGGERGDEHQAGAEEILPQLGRSMPPIAKKMPM